ncbi:MAG: GtrA-like protein family [Candidatus Peregrinibacteria bacterium Greene0416_19]|nr:MAG: GtrA-like protein family [Candidatus Peregrinibacteria bacterium Greene0416_19]
MRHFVLGKAQGMHIQFFRYFFVGGLASIVDLAVYKILTDFLHIHYLFAAFESYMAGLVANHLLSILWVFERKHEPWKEYTLVFGIALGGLAWTELLLYLAVDLAGIDDFLARIGVMFLVLGWNFGMRKVFVFH